MLKRKVIKIGIDLDGVIIDKPPFIPKTLIELLYRGHVDGKMYYRYPSTSFERWIRWLSHHWLLRPAIETNIDLLKKLSKKKNIELYTISSRYSFLNGRTRQWLKKNNVWKLFKETCLNLKDNQPHGFKKGEIEKHNLDVYIDDDLHIIKYLKTYLPKVKILQIERDRKEIEELLEK